MLKCVAVSMQIVLSSGILSNLQVGFGIFICSCFCAGGKRIAVHTQYVCKKTKQKTIHVAFQSKEKYFTFLLLLKLLRSVDQEGCESCRWEGKKCFPIDLWQDLSFIIFPI